MIRPVSLIDAAAIRGIYNYYIERTAVTFEEIPVSLDEMERRIRRISASYPWLVWEEAGDVLGYAYIHAWKDRSAYRFSGEDSIYVKQGYERRGIGRSLMTALLEEAEKTEMHALIAILCTPNEASATLHEEFGFKKCAHFSEVGFKFDRWLDVGYWERLMIR
jgi:phosphinothricin acetyltransferase